MDNSIYEVTREDYKEFVNQIKPEYRDVKKEEIGTIHTATKIYSKKTNKCLCSRVTYTANYGDPDPEKYYIFEMPDDDERLAPIPKVKIVLETKEQVQAFLDGMKRMKEMEKEKNND